MNRQNWAKTNKKRLWVSVQLSLETLRSVFVSEVKKWRCYVSLWVCVCVCKNFYGCAEQRHIHNFINGPLWHNERVIIAYGLTRHDNTPAALFSFLSSLQVTEILAVQQEAQPTDTLIKTGFLLTLNNGFRVMAVYCFWDCFWFYFFFVLWNCKHLHDVLVTGAPSKKVYLIIRIICSKHVYFVFEQFF